MNDVGDENTEAPLFRPQAVSAARSRYGAPVRTAGVASWALTALLVTIFLTVAIFVTVSKYARKETVSGVLQPTAGALRISTPKPGVVSAVHVHEGDVVRAGQPILTVDLDTVVKGGAALGDLLQDASSRETQALTDEARAHAASGAEEARELLAKRDGLIADQGKFREAIALEQAHVRLLEQSLASQSGLHDRKIISDVEFQRSEIGLIQARENLSSLEKALGDTGANVAEISAQRARIWSEAAQTAAQIRSSLAQIDAKSAANAADSQIVLTAPTAGRVVALQAKAGASVTGSGALAIILPQGAGLEAELWAPSRAAGFVRPGDRVRLLYDAFPYQRFGVGHGVVVEVASAPTLPNELPTPIETKEALYRITARLDRQDVDAYGRAWRLAPGMRLSADLILDQRSFLDWLLEPLLAAHRRVA